MSQPTFLSRSVRAANIYQAAIDRGEPESVVYVARIAGTSAARLRRELAKRGDERRAPRGRWSREVRLRMYARHYLDACVTDHYRPIEVCAEASGLEPTDLAEEVCALLHEGESGRAQDAEAYRRRVAVVAVADAVRVLGEHYRVESLAHRTGVQLDALREELRRRAHDGRAA